MVQRLPGNNVSKNVEENLARWDVFSASPNVDVTLSSPGHLAKSALSSEELHWCESPPLRESKHLEVRAAVSPYLHLPQQVPGSERGSATDVGRMDGHWQNGKSTTHLMVEPTGNNVGSAILWNSPESQHRGSLELYGVQAQGEAVS